MQVLMFGSPPRHAWIPVGRFPSGADEVAKTAAADLTAAGFMCEADPAVMDKKAAKLALNIGNAAAALSDAGSDEGKTIMQLIKEEATAAYEAAGIAVYDAAQLQEEWSAIGPQGNDVPIPDAPTYNGSSWQSLHRGTGDIESAFLNGEICLLGRLHGVPTPANAALQAAAERAAAAGHGPGTSSKAADLLARM